MKNNLTRLVNNHLPHNFNSKTLHVLDFVASGRLLGIDTADTPTSPSAGDAYHTATATTGLWDTLRMNDQLVVWTGSAWSAVVPYIGFTARVAGLGQRVYVGGGSLLESSWRETGVAATSAFRMFNVPLQPFADDPSTSRAVTSATGQIIPGGSSDYFVTWDISAQYYPLLPPGVGGGIKNVYVELQNDSAPLEYSTITNLQLVTPQGLSGAEGDAFPSEFDPYVSYPYYPISPFTVDDTSAGTTSVIANSVTAVTQPFAQSAQYGASHTYLQLTPSSFVNEGARGNGWLTLKVSGFVTGTSPVTYNYPATISLLLEQEY